MTRHLPAGLVCLALLLAAACGAPAPSTGDTAAPAGLDPAPPELRILEDPIGTAVVIGDTIAEPLPPEIAEHIPDSVIRLRARWTPGQTLRVCFVAGTPPLHQRIRDAAMEWTRHGNIGLDFGPTVTPRMCATGDGSHLRVAFNYAGYWSVVGNTPVNAIYPTMNLGAYDTAPPAEPRFTGVVLHEFGHALGFEHEHQHPEGGCDAEFNWPVVYSELAKPPNRWPPAKVDQNLRAFRDLSAYGISAPDRTSIMHYSLDPWMFIKGDASPCYVREQFALSDLDRRGVASAYPAEAERMLREERDRIQLLLRTLPTEAREARDFLDDIGGRLDAMSREISLP